MRFDAVFCSLHAPGLNWVELSERCTRAWAASSCSPMATMPSFRRTSKATAGSCCAKPLQEKELERVLQMIEPPLGDDHPF